jgi:hypothetical protein
MSLGSANGTPIATAHNDDFTLINPIRRRLPGAGYKWHLDEVVIKIAGKMHWLWRAVDQHGRVLEMLVQSRRDTQPAAPSAGRPGSPRPAV